MSSKQATTLSKLHSLNHQVFPVPAPILPVPAHSSSFPGPVPQDRLWIVSIRFPWSWLAVHGHRNIEQRQSKWPFAVKRRAYVVVQPVGASPKWHAAVWNQAREFVPPCTNFSKTTGLENPLVMGVIQFDGTARDREVDDVWVVDSRWPSAYPLARACSCSAFVFGGVTPQSPKKMSGGDATNTLLLQLVQNCDDVSSLLKLARSALKC